MAAGNVDIATILERFGLPTALIFAGLLGLWKGLWPYFLRETAAAHSDREKFLAALNALQKSQDRRDAAFEQQVKKLDNIEQLLQKPRRGPKK